MIVHNPIRLDTTRVYGAGCEAWKYLGQRMFSHGAFCAVSGCGRQRSYSTRMIFGAAVVTVNELRQQIPNDAHSNASVRWLFKYMLTDSRWALGRTVNLENPHNSGGDLYNDLQLELGDAAKLGTLSVWARLQDRGGFRPRISQLESAKWDSLFFDLPSCMGIGESAVVYDNSDVRSIYYEDAQIDKRQALKIWPKASLWRRFRDKARQDRVAFVNRESSGDINVAW
jgi:hypothetical protein